MENIYPFKLLDSYTNSPKDQKIFFGRDNEIDELYKKISSSRLVLIYGASGTGKTSLVQCGLSKKIRATDWLPIFVRRENDLNKSLLSAIVAASDINLSVISDLRDKADSKENSESYYIVELLKKVYRSSYGCPIYLIFDQFEELLILGKSPEEQHTFLKTVKGILKSNVNATLLFIVREEYLGLLYAIEKELPHITRERLRVEPMGQIKVEVILKQIAKLPNSTVHIEESEIGKIVDAIFEKICEKDREDIVQLPFLQIFLHKLYEKLKRETGEETVLITEKAVLEMEKFGNILRSYLNEHRHAIAHIVKEKKLAVPKDFVLKILDAFTTKDGTKKPLTIAQLKEELSVKFSSLLTENVIDLTIAELKGRRILKESSQGKYLEIAHDLLAEVVKDQISLDDKNKAKALEIIREKASESFTRQGCLTPSELNLIEEHLNIPKLTDIQQKFIRKSKGSNAIRELIGYILAFFFLVGGLVTFAYYENARYLKKQYEVANKELKVLRSRDSMSNLELLIKTEELKNSLDKFQEEEAARINKEIEDLLIRRSRLLEKEEIKSAEIILKKAVELLEQYPNNPYLRDTLSKVKNQK